MPIPSHELIHRVDASAPCYTTYPTADRFVQAFTSEQPVQALAQRQSGAKSGSPHPACRTGFFVDGSGARDGF
ncbi:hypothetical protein [Polaromonas sp. CG_23.6]|uniref:hypothetical protein n=1 Tax=Polaromonas sp. CG_23.6 TaxID=2760709 RepID=UPI002475184E|nr:hypothetical protein [Polaromonas sp. CG_23.6]MDH6183449.1 hypothetical protein [Polaromonas sp. CG_23.6]